jgi:phosphate-selective porin
MFLHTPLLLSATRILAVAVGALLTSAPLPLWAQSTPTDAERLQRLERAVELLQQRNAELEREVSSLKKPAAATPSVKKETARKPAPAAGNVAAPAPAKEEKKSVQVYAAGPEAKLTLGGVIQTQFEAGDIFAFEGRFGASGGGNNDRFRIRRGRINVVGNFAEGFDFKLEGDFTQTDLGLTVRDASGRTLGSNATRSSFGATDLFANWHAIPEMNVKVGQFKAPFGLEQLTPASKLFTNERTLLTTALTPDRQLGVMFWGKPFANLWPAQKDLLSYSFGIFNGTGRNFVVNDNNEFMYVSRIEVQALRSRILNQDASLKLGANALSSRDNAGTTYSSVLRTNTDGSLSSFAPPSAAERTAFGVDASVHLGPFDLVGEYISQRVGTRVVGNVAPRFTGFRADGYYVQGSYFVLPKKLQLVAKWESFNPGQLANDDIHSITGGVNYYLKGDNVKVIANYIRTFSDLRERNPGLGQDEFDEVIVRLQLLF